ncbi:hypothetical protein [Fuscovulum blasticum]|uniref:hypothetical protein n=1 Tax=Fuscovulum blasticum TaxID=1075 RepID=UPI000D3E3BFA|nr:hypothetical protein [Fuscovulum blasticum]AWD21628.1 hypothetical protein B6K69_08010 [Fuscovulum blasticum]
MHLTFDFVAPADRTFGVVVPIDTLVDAIPDALDVWAPTTASVTLASGKVSAWTGRKNGRVLAQGNTARQPVLDNGRIRMGNGSGTPAGCLELSGTQIGASTAITIAVNVVFDAPALTVDNHYVFGSASPISRLAYRYTSGNKYLRYQNLTQNFDAALAADFAGAVGAVLVISGTTATLHLTTGVSTTVTLAGAWTMASLALGAAQAAQPGDLPGSIGNVGIWSRAVSPSELATLLAWVG